MTKTPEEVCARVLIGDPYQEDTPPQDPDFQAKVEAGAKKLKDELMARFSRKPRWYDPTLEWSILKLNDTVQAVKRWMKTP